MGKSKYIDLLTRFQLCRILRSEGASARGRANFDEEMPIIPLSFCLNYVEREGLEDVALSPLGQARISAGRRLTNKRWFDGFMFCSVFFALLMGGTDDGTLFTSQRYDHYSNGGDSLLRWNGI